MKRYAWMAFSLASVGLFVGCSSDPDTVEPVPPPNYSASPDPEPLPPVSINEGSPVTAAPASPVAGPGGYEPEPLPPAEPVSRIYTVRKGDTLWSIAQREYGNGQKWKAIAQANPSLDPKKLMIGQQITLP